MMKQTPPSTDAVAVPTSFTADMIRAEIRAFKHKHNLAINVRIDGDSAMVMHGLRESTDRITLTVSKVGDFFEVSSRLRTHVDLNEKQRGWRSAHSLEIPTINVGHLTFRYIEEDEWTTSTGGAIIVQSLDYVLLEKIADKNVDDVLLLLSHPDIDLDSAADTHQHFFAKLDGLGIKLVATRKE